MTYNVLMGMLNPTHSLTHSLTHFTQLTLLAEPDGRFWHSIKLFYYELFLYFSFDFIMYIAALLA